MSTSSQTSSPELLSATTRWGGRLQQLGIYIEIIAPLVAIDGVRPCLPYADGLSDTSFAPTESLDGNFTPSQSMVWLQTAAWSVSTDW